MKKLSIFVLSFIFTLSLVACGNEATSLGIIGGADGPTAIYITSGTGWLNIYSLIGLIVATILVVFMICRKKK